MSLRGCPREIRSDNGTNFKKADKELKASIDEWNHSNIENFCTQRGINWVFSLIPKPHGRSVGKDDQVRASDIKSVVQGANCL